MRRHRYTLLIPLLLLAFGLRVWGVAQHSIWWDEGIGVWLARMPILDAVRWTAGDVHPPLYYMVLRGWYLVAGEGEAVLRYPSVLLSLLTVPLIYRLGRRLDGEAAGLLAALFLALSRFAIWWAQEIRMYALTAFAATGALWAAVWLWQAADARSRRRAWLTYVVMALSSLYSLYLAVTVVAVTNLGFLVVWQQRKRQPATRRDVVWPWLSAQAATAALFLPWALYALPRMHGWSSDAAFTPGFFVQLYTTMLAMGTPLDLQTTWPLAAAVFAGLGLGLVAVVRRTGSAARRGALAMALAGLLLPPLVVVAISLPGLSFYFSRPLAPRYLLPLSACYYALLAWGVTALARGGQRRRNGARKVGRWLAVGIALLAVATAILGLRTFYPGRARRDDYVTIAQVLRDHRRAADAVVLYVDRDWPIFTAHYAGARHDLPYGADYADPTAVEARLAPLWDEADALWLVTTPESLQADPGQAVPGWLAARAVRTETVVEGENTLTFYARTEARAQLYHTLAPGTSAPGNLAARGGLTGASIPLDRYRTGDTVHLSLYWTTPPQTVTVILQGEGTPVEIVTPPVNAPLPPLRTQVDVSLTPDLPGGPYTLSAQVGEAPPVQVGTFTLLRRAVGADLSADAIPYPVAYQLGEAIHLTGYALPEREVAPGDTVALTLYWRAGAPVAERYKVFTHLLGETFNAETETFLWGQQDNEPGMGQAITPLWAPGAIIADPYWITVAPQAPPGTYTIEVGMYGLVNGVRLPVEGPDGPVPNNAILLTTIEVTAP